MSKKDQIVKAAITVFKNKSIEKAKISDIVKEAGVAQGTYYLYFSSKLAIMPALAEVMVEKIIAEVEQSVKGTSEFEKQLEQIINSVFKITDDYHEVIALIYAGLTSSEHIKEWELIYEPFYSWMHEFLEQAQSKGKINKQYDLVYTAKLVIGLIESAAEQIYLYDSSSKKQAEKQKGEVLKFLINALLV